MRLLALLFLPAFAGCALDGDASGTRQSTLDLDVRGMYGQRLNRPSLQKIKAIGFGVVPANPFREELRELRTYRLKALVWLGDYENSTCSFEKSDAWVRERVSSIASSPVVVAYYLADEPYASECPRAPSQIQRRSDLIKSIDRSTPTFLVVNTWNGVKSYPYEDFAGTTDIMGLDVYPCSHSEGCKFMKISEAIAQAEVDKVPRYWAILQAFGDEYYRVPTTSELREQFRLWSSSRMEGYLVFSWNWGEDPDTWLKNRQELLRVLEQENLP